jgi:acyl-CoA synthetase (AMP-forming)/AMP-acid ligase II
MERPVIDNLSWRLVFSHPEEVLDRPAIECGSRTLSYRALAEEVAKAASHLARAGTGPKDRVVVSAGNSPEQIIGVLAAMSLGAIAVPVSEKMKEERFRYIVECTIPTKRLHSNDFPLAGAHASWQVPTPGRVGSKDPAMILFSSGSTGRPKGVLLTHKNLCATARLLASTYGMGAGHRELILCPVAHSDGWQRVSATLSAGGTVVFSDPLMSTRVLLEDLSRLQIHGFFMPPPLVRRLLDANLDDTRTLTSTCRTIEIGSAPLAALELFALMERIPSARVYVHYGLTECSRAVILDARRHLDKLGTVGRASRNVEIALDREGQIRLRGPQLFREYWGLESLTSERKIDGWLATGDYGEIDGDGFLTLRGRKDDLITSLGHHFFPAEAETELGTIEGVAEYVIAAVRDPRDGREDHPWAFVVPRNADHWSPRTFLAAARHRLSAHMVPKCIVTVPEIPRTESGKPDRRRAVELYAQLHRRDAMR